MTPLFYQWQLRRLLQRFVLESARSRLKVAGRPAAIFPLLPDMAILLFQQESQIMLEFRKERLRLRLDFLDQLFLGHRLANSRQISR